MDAQLSFSSVEEVLRNADFYRRMGCPGSSDTEALSEALEEALASNERLAERAQDLDKQAEDLADTRKELREAEMSLDCNLPELERASAATCKKEGDDCAECRIAGLKRDHAAELEEARATTISHDLEPLRKQLAEEQAKVAFLTEERNALLIQVPMVAPPSRAKASPRPREMAPGQVDLWDLASRKASEEPAEEPKAPKEKRERKKRLWLDAKLPPVPAKKRSKGTSP